MTRSLLISLILCVLLVFASPGWSLQVNDYPGIPGFTNVGNADSFVVAETGVSPDEKDELAWAELKTGIDLVSLGKLEGTSMVWQETIDALGTWAISFGILEPSYFLIKTGNFSGTGQWTILYQNETMLTWGVVDLVALAAQLHSQNENITVVALGKISHVHSFVPEPLSLLLLGFGLGGLAGVGRFRK